MKAPASAGTHTSHPDSTRSTDTAEEIAAYQRAARRLVRDPSLSFIQACMAILRLIQQARRSTAPELTIAAIWAEAGVFVSSGDRPLDREALVEALHASDPVDGTLRGLLRNGYVRCPRCARPLPTEAQLDRQRTLRRQGLEDALVREGAV